MFIHKLTGYFPPDIQEQAEGFIIYGCSQELLWNCSIVGKALKVLNWAVVTGIGKERDNWKSRARRKVVVIPAMCIRATASETFLYLVCLRGEKGGRGFSNHNSNHFQCDSCIQILCFLFNTPVLFFFFVPPIKCVMHGAANSEVIPVDSLLQGNWWHIFVSKSVVNVGNLWSESCLVLVDHVYESPAQESTRAWAKHFQGGTLLSAIRNSGINMVIPCRFLSV